MCSMACVEAIPVPESRKKVDELFLFWLSEPSTQELLRKELSMVCSGSYEDADSPAPLMTAAAVTSVLRPGSPVLRSPSPPTPHSRSPKSPRAKRRSHSPRKRIVETGANKLNLNNASHHHQVAEETDFHVTPAPVSAAETELQDVCTSEVEAKSQAPHPQLQADEDVATPVLSPEAAAKLPDTPKAEGGAAERDRPLSSEAIPRFYFPNGRPRVDEDVEQSLREVAAVFEGFPREEVPRNDFHLVVKVSRHTHTRMHARTHTHTCSFPG